MLRFSGTKVADAMIKDVAGHRRQEAIEDSGAMLSGPSGRRHDRGQMCCNWNVRTVPPPTLYQSLRTGTPQEAAPVPQGKHAGTKEERHACCY